MGEMFAISRIEKYKFHDCGGVWKEAIRTLPKYDNPNLNPDLSHLNVHLIDNDINNIEKYIVQYKEDHNISGRFNLTAKNTKNAKNLTNVMCQALFTCSNDYINTLSRDDQIEFFKYCLEFFKEEFPDVPILSAVVHYDETTPHMHLTFLPIVSRFNSKTNQVEKICSTTVLMPGKDFYPKYQDRFFAFISTKYEGLTRRKSTRKNLTPEEYRKVAPILEEYECEINRLQEKYLRLRKLYDNPLIRMLVNILSGKSKDPAAAIQILIQHLESERRSILDQRESLDTVIARAESNKKPSRVERIVKNIKELF